MFIVHSTPPAGHDLILLNISSDKPINCFFFFSHVWLYSRSVSSVRINLSSLILERKLSWSLPGQSRDAPQARIFLNSLVFFGFSSLVNLSIWWVVPSIEFSWRLKIISKKGPHMLVSEALFGLKKIFKGASLEK